MTSVDDDVSLQDTFGKHVNNPTLTKLPARLFEDFSPGGALCQIMAVAFRTKAEQLWRRFDFHSPSRIDRGIELFMSIHKELTQTKVWEPPKVLINTTLGPALMTELTEIVKRHQVLYAALGNTSSGLKLYTFLTHQHRRAWL